MVAITGRRRVGRHRAGGGGGGFVVDATPPALGGGSGCRLYVARGYGLYTDAGTTLATAAGQTIYRWKDYSGSNNHLDQSTSAWRPTAGTAAQLVFGNLLHFLVPGAVGSGVTDGEAFVLVKLTTIAVSNSLWMLGGNDVSVYRDVTFGLIFEGAGTSGRYNFTAPSGLTTYHVYSVRTDASGGWDALKDNTAISGAARTGNTPDWTSQYLGASYTKSVYLNGEIAACVFYAGARTSGERASIVSVLLGMAPP